MVKENTKIVKVKDVVKVKEKDELKSVVHSVKIVINVQREIIKLLNKVIKQQDAQHKRISALEEQYRSLNTK